MVQRMLHDPHTGLPVGIFRLVDDDFKEEAIMRMMPLSFAVRETILERGVPSTELYFITKGEVLMSTVNTQPLDGSDDGSDDDERMDEVCRLTIGSYFGETCLAPPPAPNKCPLTPAKFVAATKCEVFILTKDDLNDLMDKFPGAGARIRAHVRIPPPPSPHTH